jgi:hypothetical protein
MKLTLSAVAFGWTMPWAIALTVVGTSAHGDEEEVVLRGEVAQASVAVDGGGIIEFRYVDQQINPLNWNIGDLEPGTEGQPHPRGHFLCLDRWGAPSEREAKNGVPFHGEAPRVVWQVTKPAQRQADELSAHMGCTLPLAGMRVQRSLTLDAKSALLTVTEQVTNSNLRGRIYNMVQHPSIAPPFLDESTVIDSNACYGFSQEGSVPEPQETASAWPEMTIGDRRVDLRRFRHASAETTGHDVSSFMFDEAEVYGWVTACNPGKGLLIGYVWRTADYPWLNIWRYMRDGSVAARGLEFGTTGYHQPFGQLVKTGRILGRPLYVYLDAGETVSKSYAVFLLPIPGDYQGVARVTYQSERLTVTERGKQKPRTLELAAGKLFGN